MQVGVSSTWAQLAADHFPTLVPRSHVFDMGIVFKGRRAKNAETGVWEESEETTDAYPEVLKIKPGSWAAADGFVVPGSTLVTINGRGAPGTLDEAKMMLQAAAATGSYVELVWRAGCQQILSPAEIPAIIVERQQQEGLELYFNVPDLDPSENTLRYWSLPANCDAPPNAVVLFVHGLGCAGRDRAAAGFDHPHVRMLCRFGHVVAPDLLGHGGSAVPRGEDNYRMRRHAACLVQLLQHLQADSVYLVGHSMGGPIALATAEMLRQTDHSPRICSVLYSEPNIDGGDCLVSRRVVHVYQGQDLEAQWNESIGAPSSRSRQIQLQLANAACCRDLVRESDCGELLPRMQSLRGGDNPVPSLCLIGSQNRGVLTSETALLDGDFPVQYIEAAGHCQHIDNPQEFYAAAQTFFATATAEPDVSVD